MKYEKSCGAIIELNNKILLIKQLNTGNIGFPKGHIIDGETEVETAIREVKEETNVDVIIDERKKYLISYVTNKNANKDVVYFLAKPKENFTVKKQDCEIDDIFWINKEDVRDMLTFNNLKELWDKALNDLNE